MPATFLLSPLERHLLARVVPLPLVAARFGLVAARFGLVAARFGLVAARFGVVPKALALGEVQRGGALEFRLAHECRAPLIFADGGENGANIGRITGA